jgi:hypothetical protein
MWGNELLMKSIAAHERCLAATGQDQSVIVATQGRRRHSSYIRDRAEDLRFSIELSEQENAKLKKSVAERDLEIDVMKEVAAKNVWSAPCLQEFSFEGVARRSA